MQTFELFTLNFQKFDPAMGTAVRISNGAPRWKLKYDLSYSIKELHPRWALVKAKLPHAEFAAAYRADLAETGVDVIASRLRAVAAAAGDPRLVLMCFEDLSTGKTCHRTVFGDWWTEITGEPVVELAPAGSGSPRTSAQSAPADPTLFEL